jgi:radical SAM protein with 4Fe4S-binding SPASM domain
MKTTIHILQRNTKLERTPSKTALACLALGLLLTSLLSIALFSPVKVQDSTGSTIALWHLDEILPDGYNEITPDAIGQNSGMPVHAPVGCHAGIMYFSLRPNGDVYPSTFLPVKVGNIREQSLTSIWRNSKVLKELRQRSLLKGECGDCEYREACGGCR